MKKKLIITFEKKKFIIGIFGEIVDFLLNTNFKKTSQIFLPCSLHDLALMENNHYYENIDYCTSDSMWLTYFFNFRINKKIDRVYGPNLMLAILDKEKSLNSTKKHFFLASDLETGKKIKNFLTKKYQNLNMICNFLNKDFSKEEEEMFYKKILKIKPEFIWIGIGSPKQLEIASYFKNNSTNVRIFCVGAAFNFFSGNQKQAPFFIQQIGFEWLFRLCHEPNRLWRRYLLIIPKYLLRKACFFSKKCFKL